MACGFSSKTVLDEPILLAHADPIRASGRRAEGGLCVMLPRLAWAGSGEVEQHDFGALERLTDPYVPEANWQELPASRCKDSFVAVHFSHPRNFRRVPPK